MSVSIRPLHTKSIEELHEKHETLTKEDEILSSLINDLEDLRKSTYLSFEDEENLIIEAFSDLIDKKKNEIDAAFSIRNRIDKFLNSVKLNIQSANSTLSEEAQEKSQAQEAIRRTINNAGTLFRKLNYLRGITEEIEAYDLSHKEEIELDSEVKLCLEVFSEESISELIIDGIKDANGENLYLCLLNLLYGHTTIKNYGNNEPQNLKKKTLVSLSDLLKHFDKPSDFLEYNDGSNSKSNSPGYNSEKYLQVILNNPSSNLIFIDQPEDNLGNSFISEKLVDSIRELKFEKQLFLVTHNPAIVVYGDAESITLAENINNTISYTQIKLEDEPSQKKICSVLDGGEYIFHNRARKYNIQKLLSKKD